MHRIFHKFSREKKLILSIDIVIFIIIVAVFLFGKIIFSIIPPCYNFQITGLLCPSCGGTRMLKSILQLDFISAFKFNPLLFIALIYGIILLALFNAKAFSPALSTKCERVLCHICNMKVFVLFMILLVAFTVIRNIGQIIVFLE